MKQTTLDLIKNINENTIIPATTQNELFELFQLDTVADLRKVSRNFMKVYELLEHFDNQTSNATTEKEGIVKFGTEAGNAIDAETWKQAIGLEFGGNIQDIGNKTKGKFYYDSVTKFYYECIVNNSLTYNDSSKFRAISNKPISDKVENLFKITEYKTITLQNVQKGSATGYSIGNIAVFNFHDVKPASRNGNAVIARLPVTPLVSIETVASAVSEESSIRISVDREGAVRIISGGILPETLKEYTFSVTFPFAI